MLKIRTLLSVTKLNSLIKNLFKNKESLVDILASSQKLLHKVNKKMQWPINTSSWKTLQQIIWLRKISKIFHFSQMKSFFCLIFCDVTRMLYKVKLRKFVLLSIFFSTTNHSTIDSQKCIYPLTMDYTSHWNVILKGYQLLLFTNHFFIEVLSVYYMKKQKVSGKIRKYFII